MLISLIENELKQRNISLREGAKQIGFSHTTLARVLDGYPLDLDTLIKITKWLNINPGELINTMISDESELLASKVSVLLARSPRIKELFSDMVSKIETGELDPSILDDAMDYLDFKMKTAGQ